MSFLLNRVAVVICLLSGWTTLEAADQPKAARAAISFTIRSVANGRWSQAKTWQPARVPKAGDRVLVARGTRVIYDVASTAVIRMVQVAGTLEFARDRKTELNVGLLKVQNSQVCSESGFACDFHGTNDAGEPHAAPKGPRPALLIGTPESPIPAGHTARVRLHFLEGMDRNSAPAIACCSARLEIHGSPLSRSWVELGADAGPGDRRLVLGEAVSGWRIGDELIVTGSERRRAGRTYRGNPESATTEARRITAIDGLMLTLDRPLAETHPGSGEFRCEVANLSRNVVIESADPGGVRGHTVFHRFSQGSISHARFAHLGKEGLLGRYAIHFHKVGDTMRGSSVTGVAIVDSHNRWITIHGTQYLVVRDCVGYQSVGHGFFLEDGTEVFNLLERNLAVQAYRGRRLPDQVLPFDQNDGAGFWWPNGLNTLVGNVAAENDHYGFRYDVQKTSRFDPRLPIRTAKGRERVVDIRTLGIWRFENNESHTNFAGMVVAGNGGRQPDSPIRDQRMLQRIKGIDWTGPDRRHPHVLRNFTVWNTHYAVRFQSPSMLLDGLRIDRAAYGVYRPYFKDHVYRNLHLSRVGPEPFNRGMDDVSAQLGSFTVDGLTLEEIGNSSQNHPIIHMTDNDLSGGSEAHFRNVVIRNCDPRRPVFNRGGSVRVDPFVELGVPYFIHDHFGPGRHAKIVSTLAKHLLEDGHTYRKQPPLTGDQSVVAEVSDIKFPKLLDPVDDLPPATVILSAVRTAGRVLVRGVSHDNGTIRRVIVSGAVARLTRRAAGVVDWQVELPVPRDGWLVAAGSDTAGNVEQTPHRLLLDTPTDGDKPMALLLRPAIERSLALIERSTTEWLKQRRCFSCHHQALPTVTLASAREHGFEINEENFKQQVDRTANHLERGRKNYLEGRGQGGRADTAGYALWALEAAGRKPDEITAAVTNFLLAWSKDRDYWRHSSNRPPSEASDFTTTYLVLRGLGSFATDEQTETVAVRRKKAFKWLVESGSKETEERVFRLRALTYLKEGGDSRNATIKALLESQHEGGGWSQLDQLDSDAYATGTVLVALHRAGALKTTDPAYRRGLSYLLKTQQPDGSWYVKSRSKPFQTYFESGFPHGPDQFISMAASCWATMALIESVGSK